MCQATAIMCIDIDEKQEIIVSREICFLQKP